MKLLFVINPKAGKRKNKKCVESVIDVFEKAGYLVSVKYTDKKAGAVPIVEKYGSKVDLVVCMGGDGTLNEAMRGLMNIKCGTPLGYIPAGSTNDFAHSLGLKTNPKQQAEFLMSHEPRDLDLGMFNGRVFVYTAATGICAETSYATPQKLKNKLGHLAYVLTAFKELFKIKKLKFRVELEDEVLEDTYIFAAINNATKIGGVMKLDEKLVKFNDGVFELLLIQYPKKFGSFFKLIFKVLTQKYNGEIIFKHITSAKITDNSDVDWSLDGEKEKGKKDIEFKVIPNAIKFIY